jgi:hypothetical protein
MKKLELLSTAGWATAGLLALRMVLATPATARQPVVEAIRASCDLPAGTVVFVVRDSAGEAR